MSSQADELFKFFSLLEKINTEMAQTDAINCGFDVGFPSFLVCSKKPGFFVLKILLPFASMQGKTLLYTEIVSHELDLQVKAYYTWELRGKGSMQFWLEAGGKDVVFPGWSLFLSSKGCLQTNMGMLLSTEK